jgi:type I restriction enzyme S subunit
MRTRTDRLRALSQGLAQGVITREMLAQLEIRLPPLAEQQRIAAILDKADALRRKRKRAIDLLNSLTQSIFVEMFVNTKDGSWPLATVETVSANMRTGPFGSQLLHSEFVDEGIAVLGIDNVVANEFLWGQRRYITPQKYHDLRRYTVLPNDVLITIMGTCGRCAIAPDNIPLAINTKHLCCITLNQQLCLPEFLQAVFLQHPSVLRQLGIEAKGAVMPGLNMGIIRKLSFPLPPLKRQEAFQRLLRGLRQQRAVDADSALRGNALFSSLQHRAFSGQL